MKLSILHLLGKPKSVYSLSKKTDNNLEYIYTTYKYEDAVANAEGGWVEHSFGFVQAIRGVFEDGTVLEYNFKNQPLIIYGKEKTELVNIPEIEADSVNVGGNISDLGAYYNEDKYWIECLENDKYPEIVTPEDAIASLGIIFKEIESVKTGKEVLV